MSSELKNFSSSAMSREHTTVQANDRSELFKRRVNSEGGLLGDIPDHRIADVKPIDLAVALHYE